MAKLYVIQTGRTVWDEQTRIEPLPGAPLAPSGLEDVRQAARQLASASITTIYACTGQAEQETAMVLADELGAKIRIHKGLRELDYGLWQGLTQGELKRRQPKLFRQWNEAPASVRPPGGETLAEAEQRIRKAIREIVKRHRNGEVLVVLRPVVHGLLRCLLRHDTLDALWQNVDDQCCWELLEADHETLRES